MNIETSLDRVENKINVRTNEHTQNIVNKWNIYQKIPSDIQKVYENIGLLEHPGENGEPVKKLTAYQKQSWMDNFKYKYNLIVKSQKIGISTSELMADFNRCIIPTTGHKYSESSTMGFDTLIIAQTYPHAKEHIRTLYDMISQSIEYRDFLVDKPSEEISKKDRTRANILILRNPENPAKVTRIIGLGPTASGVWSWKRIKHIHMSDVAAIDQIDDRPLFAAAFSRLASTKGKGSMTIETPPRGEQGKVYQLYKDIHTEGNEAFERAKFHYREYPATMAVDAGLITEDWLEDERERQGVLYGMLYECKFLNPYTTWYPTEGFNYDLNPDYVVY